MKQLIEETIELVDSSLKRSLTKYAGRIPNELYEGMLYACFGGGKRIRPILFLISAQSLGLEKEKLSNIAAAIELFHSYSLVHDDLPGMDNDVERRGKPTVHVKYGQGMAILIGDALLNAAFETMIDAICNEPKYNKMIKYISEKTGSIGMIGGQAKDIKNSNISIDTALDIYMGKTAALFEAAIVSPLFLVSTDKNLLKDYELLANLTGTIFQLKDDFLDYKTQKDKINFVSLAGYGDATSFMLSMIADLYVCAEKLSMSQSMILQAIDFLILKPDDTTQSC